MKFVITFQAIQNFIPDGEGRQIPNTITNSLKIFNAFDTDDLEITDLSLFVIENVSGNVTIKAKTGVTYPETLVLPQTDASGNTITHIDSSFANLAGVKNLVIPSGYTTIEAGAFKGSSLENVDMSDSSITEIPDNAFQSTYSLESVTLPEGLEILGENSFYGSSITSINLPSSLKRIEKGSLWNTSIISLYISENVEYISDSAIRSTLLAKIVVDEGNSYYYDNEDMVLYSYNNELLLTISTYPNTTFEIPEGITTLFSYAMSLSHITTLYIPSSLSLIRSGALPSNYLENVEVDDDNTTFYTSTGKELINKSTKRLLSCFVRDYSDYTIPDGVLVIPAAAFSSTLINTLYIGKDLTSIEDAAMVSALFRYFQVDSDNQYFFTEENYALISNSGRLCKFSCVDLGFYSYTVHGSVKTILPGAFYKSCLISIEMLENVQSCRYQSFTHSFSLKNVTMTSSITYLENNCFYNCPIEEITVHGKLITRAFNGVTKLKKVILEESVTNIGVGCFYNCTSLEILVFKSTTPPNLDSVNIFGGTTPTTFKIYVPDEALETYKTAENYAYYANKIYPVSELQS